MSKRAIESTLSNPPKRPSTKTIHPMDVEDPTAEQTIDESLYSRQLYVMGHAAQKKMMNANVVIVGLSGLGVEIAKNIILAGVKSVTLHDPSPVTSFDLGGNFYFTEEDIGKPRAATCHGKLSELNQYVPVTLSTSDTIPLANMRCCVVTCGYNGAELVTLNDQCRAMDCSFIMTNSVGVFGQIFVDNGKEFEISDTDGEQPHSAQIEAITVENPGVVKVLEDQGRHGLETGDVVEFTRVKGMPFLNETKVRVRFGKYWKNWKLALLN